MVSVRWAVRTAGVVRAVVWCRVRRCGVGIVRGESVDRWVVAVQYVRSRPIHFVDALRIQRSRNG